MLRVLLRSRKTRLGEEDVTVVDRLQVRRAVSAAALGNMMEWFDFGVYAYLAATLGKVFFPSSSPGVQVISAFATFAAAFVVRPLGGFVFGPLGDRIGRQRVLAATMIMMAVSTFAVGFLPTYGAVGTAAPLLLLVCRLVQGFSTGGEYAGATTYIAEYSPDRKRGFLGSWLDFGTFVGYSLGSALVTVLTGVLSGADMASWGWRIPFYVAGPLGLIGLYMRLRLGETPAFRRAEQAHREAPPDAQPAEDPVEQYRMSGRGRLKELITRYWKPMLICGGLVLVYNVTNYMVTSYLPTYMTATLHVPALTSQLLVLGTMLLVVLTITVVGRSSDRIGRRPVLLSGAVAMVVLAIPAFGMIRQGGLLWPSVGCALLGLLLVTFAGVSASTLPALFPTHLRYGGLSVAYNISVSLFGGTTPLLASFLVNTTHDTMVPAYYLMVAGLIGTGAALVLRESAGRPLRGAAPTVETQEEARTLLAEHRTHESRRARRMWIAVRRGTVGQRRGKRPGKAALPSH